jgi:acyl-CoA reductase-like NAD-dependent aldehyde dehydrogenase
MTETNTGLETVLAAAKQAQGNWQSMPAKERSKILRRWNDLILQHFVTPVY